LVPGQSIEFEVEGSDRGPRAVRVTGSVSAGPVEEREVEVDSGLLARTVYVGNLCYGASDTELSGVFEGAGEVDKVTRITDREGNPRRYAFVQMKDERAVQQAIKKLGGARVKNRSMTVARAKPPSPGRGRGRPSMRRKV
jgi:RNA recognition motif-containing protein